MQEYDICEDCVYFAEYGRLDDTTMMEVEKDAAKPDRAKLLASLGLQPTDPLPSYVDGGYPVHYLFEDGEVCCAECANGKDCTDREARDDKQWNVISQHPYWEGPPLECSNCSRFIESAYGDPEAPEINELTGEAV